MLLDTPLVLIDNQKMMSNIDDMSEAARRNGVVLRPHVKTHKIPSIAKLQIQAGASGITVAKVAEAEMMANNGLSDIFIAYPIIVPSKIKRVVELAAKIRIIVGVDSLEGAKRLSDAAMAYGIQLEVRLEVDTGLKRTGIVYEKTLQIAKQIHALSNVRLTGIFTYRGAMLHGLPTLEIQKAGLEEGHLMVTLANDLKENGISIADVSVGSTPTGKFAAEVQGVTEIRPGTYVFYDRMQAQFGVCSLEDCAAVVVTTIVSMPSEEILIIDGGSKTFATDVQPNTNPLHLVGYGHVVNYPSAVLERMYEEHVIIKINKGHPFQIGDTLEIIPNHICSTINLHNQIYLKKNDNTIETMTVLGRGMLH
jgi:D-serine deaminase-like pyridoxal phosphate-dependent protein